MANASRMRKEVYGRPLPDLSRARKQAVFGLFRQPASLVGRAEARRGLRSAPHRIACVVVAMFSFSILSAAQPSTTRVGIYHWSGAASTSIAEGVERVAALGGHTVRIALSARS